jgi:hypothetical protein
MDPGFIEGLLTNSQKNNMLGRIVMLVHMSVSAAQQTQKEFQFYYITLATIIGYTILMRIFRALA